MNPLSKPTAVLEMLIMLGVALTLGYLLHWIMCKLGLCGGSCCGCDGSCKNTKMDKGVRSFLGKDLDAKVDDLKIIEGIGPKIEMLLNVEGVYTFEDMTSAGVGKINKILEKAGTRFAMHDAATWIKQAELADAGDWDGLKKLQAKLTAGR